MHGKQRSFNHIRVGFIQCLGCICKKPAGMCPTIRIGNTHELLLCRVVLLQAVRDQNAFVLFIE